MTTLNAFIANAHRLQRKTLGSVIALGGVIAYVLSVILIVTGILLQAYLNRPSVVSGWLLVTVYSVIWGIAALCIGLLVERMTLGGCSKYRIACEKSEIIRENFEKISGPTKEVETQYQTDLSYVNKDKGYALGLIVLGACLSIFCESLIIHYLFSGWSDWHVGQVSIPVGVLGSLFLSGLVSYTLISSELHKRQEAEVIHESIMADSFLPIAARANVTDRVHMQMLAKSTVKVDEIVNTDTIDSAFEHAVKSDIDHLLDGKGTIILRIDNERRQKELQIAAEKEKTRHQLRLLKGGMDAETDLPNTGELPLVSGGSTSVLNSVTRKMRGDGVENLKKIYSLYRQMGEDYFTPERKEELAQNMDITVRSIDRILQKIRNGEVVSQ